MNIVKPIIAQFVLPATTREVNIAEHQAEYQTLPSLVTPDGKVASQWRPDANELAMLNAGVPITLVCWTFGRPLQPVSIGVGGMDLR